MAGELDKCHFADASIRRLIVEAAELRIDVLNWREIVDVYVFRDVLGFEGVDPNNEDLSHGEESASDPFLTRCCATAGEPTAEYRCFSFVSAWRGEVVLKIVARSFEMTPGPER